MSEGMKFRCSSPAHSKLIQEWLFKQGYTWGGEQGQVAKYTDRKYLFAYNNSTRMLTHDDCDSVFNSKPFVEQVVTTKTVSVLQIVSVAPKREKVVLFGKTYFKSDVDAALAELEIAYV